MTRDVPEESLLDEVDELDASDISNNEAIFGGPILSKVDQSVAGEYQHDRYEAVTSWEEETTPIHVRESSQGSVIPVLTNAHSSRGVVDLSYRTPEYTAPRVSIYTPTPRPKSVASIYNAPRSGSFASKAVFVSVAGLAIVVALIGSGIVDSMLERRGADSGLQATVVNALQGETIYKKTK